MQRPIKYGRSRRDPTWFATSHPTPFFASLHAIRRLAIGAALGFTLFSQIGGHVGMLKVEHLRLFELTGIAAILWIGLLIAIPWERFPIGGLTVMSVAATLVVLAAVSLSGGSDSPAWIYYVVIAVFNALYFPPRLAYCLLGVTIAALMAPSLLAGDGTAVLLASIISLPVYIALTVVASGLSADARTAERRRLTFATARERLAEADRWADRLEAIQRIGGQLHRVTTVPDLGDTLLRQTARVIPFDHGRFAIVSGGALLDIADFSSGAGSDPGTDRGQRSETTVAVVHDGIRLGRLILERGGKNPFTTADRRLLSIIATFAASAVANARLFELARSDAERDGLTGLFNRRAGLARLTEAIAHSRQTRMPLAVCMIDLDGFKSCNDRFGHPAGDVVLRDVAQRLLTACRDDDTAARYGGDEFLVILPGAGAAMASEMCDRFRSAVSGLPVVPDTGGQVTISLSAGIAVFPHDGNEAQALIVAADEALYAAKRIAARRPAAAADSANVGPIFAGDLIDVGALTA